MPSSPGAEPAARPGEGEVGRSTERPLHIAFVVPRFGERVVGGAELLASWLAERLAGCGHGVEILTTCALNHFTWENELPPGDERYGPLLVRRFLCDERDAGIHGELERAIAAGVQLSREEELLWMRNGVASRQMEEALEREGDRFDMVIPLPYLFGTTYFAYAACPSRTIPIPCLHDEPYAKLGVVSEMLSGARGIFFNTPAEAQLAGQLAGELPRWTTVGLGFDPPTDVDPSRVRRRYSLERPFVLYVGRREGGKNTPLLQDNFMRYKHRRPGDLELVFVGGGDAPPKHPDIRELDFDWADRDSLYAAATVFCQPSVNESLSIVLMQAWLAERPVVVHGACPVTREHCQRSNGGLWFTSYAEFEEVFDRLVEDGALREALGSNGARYVRSEYSWEAVLGRFHEAARSWVLDE